MPGPKSSTPASAATSRKCPFGVAVEILAAEIVGDVQVGPAVAVVVAPGGGEAEAVVVVVHAGGGGHVLEVAGLSVEAVAEQEIGRPVLRVVIRHRIAVLRLALVVDVAAEVEIQAAVAIVIGRGDAGERALRRRREAERIGQPGEPALAVVQKQQRLVGADQHQVLVAGVAQIDEQRAGRVVQQCRGRPACEMSRKRPLPSFL